MEPRRLLLLRHAKSSWDDPSLRDIERPLARRGQRDAPRMGAYMRAEDLTPDLVLCSPSQRTRETWALVVEGLGEGPPVEYMPDLYHSAASGMLRVIRAQEENARTLLLVAHNPGTEDLAVRLTGHADPTDLDRMRAKFPTAALAELQFDAEGWNEVEWGSGRLVRFVIPRSLP